MKRINAYKKLFQVEDEINLKDLKKTYRSLVKEWHPDKFMEGHEQAEKAEDMSRQIIDGYHFLVSISPETKTLGAADYIAACESGIADFKHKSLLLEITFMNGATYEYFGVNRNLFIKFVNADKQFRFAKRNILNSFEYRKSKREIEAA